MDVLKKDTTDRSLGKTKCRCRICGSEGEFDTYLAREMMQGTREEFRYFVCGNCRCLQIAEIPENLGDYYAGDYYSFQVPENAGAGLEGPGLDRGKILDVGCGNGQWLLDRAKGGWGNLYGCDPFIERDCNYGSRVTIRNCSIHEMEGDGTFDLILMSDSFEHMTDPLETLQSAKRLLKKEGHLLMLIPTYPNIAFEMFGTHWYQLDAPRHIFLHSKQSLQWLSYAGGLTISKMKYDSNGLQFIRSWFYENGIPFLEQDKLMGEYFGRADIEKLEEEASVWNEKEMGDHMEVWWTKT